ncbi:MAG: TonB-dependent receptor [Flavobacteriales bacterium]
MKKQIFLFAFLLSAFAAFAQEKFTISGYVKNSENQEVINGATIQIKENGLGTTSNEYGFFSITLPTGTYNLIISYVGMETIEKTITLDQNTKLDFNITSKPTELTEVKISAKRKSDNVKKIEMSTVQMDIKSITKMPALLGEPDVIRTVQTLPGVSTVGEGATGFNVRGGNIDQNLILLDEAPVFNSSHLFGFFSVFNPDAVKSVKLIKGGINAQYGGRASSVLDVRMKEGNKNKYTGSGGVGVIFSRLTLEGPIPFTKKKASFIVAGRRSYIDVLSKPFRKGDLKDAKFYFYDFTAKANWDINNRNKVFLSGYFGRDVFGSSTFGFNWGNSTTTLRWNHLINEKIFLNTTAYYSNYDYNLGTAIADGASDGFNWKSNIINYSIKPEFTWYPNTKNTVRFGAQSILYDLKPGTAEFSSGGIKSSITLADKNALETAVYIDNEQKIGSKIIVSYGLRFSGYQFIGKGKSYEYKDTLVGKEKELISTTDNEAGKIIQEYYNPEPRVAFKYDVNSKSSIKASYNRMSQYIHLLSNTAASTPLDMWTLSTNNIAPQIANQVAAGYFRNIGTKSIVETSVEVYYKTMTNQLEYIQNASLLLNETYEGQLLAGLGRSYGVELFARKNEGRLTGWVSYTFSRSERQTESINQNNWYPARFDKTHNVNLIASYNLTKRIELGANFVFTTGAPSTFPNSKISVQGLNYAHIANDARNNYRITPYHRVDLSITFKPKVKENRKWYGEWVVSVYNVYARKNAFTIYFRTNPEDPKQTQAVQYTIISTVIPSVSYNFKF